MGFQVADLLEPFTAFQRYVRRGIDADVTCCRAADTPSDTTEWAFQLCKTNMQARPQIPHSPGPWRAVPPTPELAPSMRQSSNRCGEAVSKVVVADPRLSTRALRAWVGRTRRNGGS